MITGFNTDIKHNEKVYHVQTEDKGVGNPYIESLVYVGGEILASKKTSYAEQLKAGGIAPELFFRALPEHFPGATTLFIEGTVIASSVAALLDEHGEVGDFMPGANTLWPESKKLRCRFSAQLVSALA